MLWLDSSAVYRSERLGRLPWLLHGFGTRASVDWPPAHKTAKQTHSDSVLVADGLSGCVGEGDALLTSEAGSIAGVRTADCVPILLVDTARRIAAAVHAGWRGTVGEIAPKAVKAMAFQFGSKVSDLEVSIGPGIGPCCFEVGPEVFDRFSPAVRNEANRLTVDLPAANQAQLVNCGIPVLQIEASSLCTVCHTEFYSFRRNPGEAGRMVSAIGILRVEH